APRLFRLRQLEQDLQRAIERLARVEQGRKLLGELHHLRLAQRRALEQRSEQAGRIPAVRLVHLERNVAGILQLADHLVAAGEVELALQRFARGGYGLVVEEGHGIEAGIRDSGFEGGEETTSGRGRASECAPRAVPNPQSRIPNPCLMIPASPAALPRSWCGRRAP